MTLGSLLSMYENGALKVEHEENSLTGSVGGVILNAEQASMICENLGWLKWVLNPFEIIKKTNKFIRALKRSVLYDNWTGEVWNNTTVTFQNFRSNTYGKTYDRIVLKCPYYFSYTIIYGMENQGAAYVVYSSGNAIPMEKCRTLSKVAEYIINNYKN